MEIKAKEILELVEGIEQRDTIDLEEGILNEIYCKLLDLITMTMDIRDELRGKNTKKKGFDVLEDDIDF